MAELPITDVIEIEQVLARYAVAMTQNDIETVMTEVFTPDGTYSAFGSTYALADFPALVEAAPKGLFMTGTPVLDLDGDTRQRQQPLLFIDQTNHHMRMGWYTDTYVRTERGLAAEDAVHDVPAPQRRARRRQGARPAAPRADRRAGRLGPRQWSSTPSARRSTTGSTSTPTSSLPPTTARARSTSGWPRSPRCAASPSTPAGRAGAGRSGSAGLGGSTLLRAYLSEAVTARDLVEPGLYSMPEVLGPSVITFAPPELSADDAAAAAARRRGLVPGVLRTGHGQQPGVAHVPRRRAPTTAGG